MTSQTSPVRQSRGFTLIELLVVVAVIAILVAVLLPALGGARSAAQRAAGQSNVKQLLLGLTAYAGDSNGDIPGLNTTGKELIDPALDPDDLDSSSKPIQTTDWLSPTADPGLLPANREQRVLDLMERFRCPAQGFDHTNDLLIDASGDLDTEVTESGGSLAGVSYLMPSSWQLFGPDVTSRSTNLRDVRFTQLIDDRDAVLMPGQWQPRLDRIRQASNKVAIADGFSNVADGTVGVGVNELGLTATGGGVFNSSLFMSLPPVYADSNQYNFDGNLLDQAYRHSDEMNIGLWDGSVRSVSREESADPALWYPTGSEYVGTAVPQETVDYGYVAGDFLP